MQRITSCFSRSLVSPSVFGRSSLSFASLAFRAPSYVLSRSFATKKTIDAPAVKAEKFKTQTFIDLLEEEIAVLSATSDDAPPVGGATGNLRSEVASRYLKDTNFKLTEDKENGVVKLTRNMGTKLITVTFPDHPQGDETTAPMEEELDAEEEEEAKEEEEDGEEGAMEDEGEKEEREQPFTVDITSSTKSGQENKVSFHCYASQSGSFTVSELNSGDGKKIPVQIAIWGEELQNQLILYMESVGINERLSHFIHQYLDQATQRDNVDILKDFKKFIQD